ncbi:hypothetical protein [Virgibacillus sp. YIM 98842]|uniref:hypothetical protein n=1 Tax=Virgibacillus sp. YIM 98842 TaxID=2663533 RepID=UPI0013DAD98C|nr:hypothetical protein [Virgibacillus sp. YIM 98842]
MMEKPFITKEELIINRAKLPSFISINTYYKLEKNNIEFKFIALNDINKGTR